MGSSPIQVAIVASVAQLVEQGTENPRVVGSIFKELSNLVALISLRRLRYYITFGRVCQVVFQKFFEKVLKTSTEGHIPCGWRRHPDLNWGVRVLQTLALPLGYSAEIGADYEARTRYPHLGKVALYQMS